MCGRFALYAPASSIAEVFGLEPDDLPEVAPRYNVAPTDPVLAVRTTSSNDRVAETFRWGLVPFWAKSPRIGARMINARSETAPTHGAFKHAFRRRRCVVVASGFYEWRAEGGQKLPWYYRRDDDGPMALAGLWERWDKGDEVRSCTILTAEANDLVRPVHDRMPVVLSPAEVDRWLDPDLDPESARALLGPYEGDALVAHRVSTRVNHVKNDGPDLVEPQQTDGPAE